MLKIILILHLLIDEMTASTMQCKNGCYDEYQEFQSNMIKTCLQNISNCVEGIRIPPSILQAGKRLKHNFYSNTTIKI